jgi:pimeloyl-ACP methyl ester carboxylesterase
MADAIEPVERFLSANGLTHHVLCWNDDADTTVVLLHGFLDQAWSFHGLAQPLAAAGLRVVALDWRGHGETDHVGAGGYYHFPDYVLDLHELMPYLASGPVHLLGHSMGGTVAALYAATHPHVARTLTLVEGLGPPDYAGTAPEKLSAWLDSMDRFRKKGPRPMEDLADAVKRLRAQSSELPTALAYFLAEKGTKPALDGDGLVWRFDPLHRTTSPAAFSAETFREFLVRIAAPTLVVTGSRGFRTVDHQARVLASKDAREVVVEEVGHMIHWMAPEPLARLVIEHVRR